MNPTTSRKAITLVELAVTCGFLALLASVIVPSFEEASVDAAHSMCLANLQRLGAASLAYATDDDREQIVPIHGGDVRSSYQARFPATGPWFLHTVLPHAFGGCAAKVPFPSWSGSNPELQQEGRWGAATRGLSSYVYGDGDPNRPKVQAVFHCPADTGYPETAADWGNIPTQAAGIPCYDLVGNSYASNRCGYINGASGGITFRASLSSGAFGHAASSIEDASQVVLYCDPLFYDMVRELSASDVPPDPVPGWHGQLMADNVAYCDGSARRTEVGELRQWTSDELEEMGVYQGFVNDPLDALIVLRRGDTWRMDCYPTPGAVIMVYRPDLVPFLSDISQIILGTGWPFDGYSMNPPPTTPG